MKTPSPIVPLCSVHMPVPIDSECFWCRAVTRFGISPRTTTKKNICFMLVRGKMANSWCAAYLCATIRTFRARLKCADPRASTPGTPIHWYTGKLVYQDTGTRVQQHTGTPVHRYTSTPIPWYTGIPAHWYTGSSVHSYMDEAIHLYIGILIHRSLAELTSGPKVIDGW